MRPHDNPFNVQRLDALPFQLTVTQWEALLKRTAFLGYRGNIYGPHGSGKTTLLQELALRLVRAGCQTQLLQLTQDTASSWPKISAEMLPTTSAKTILLLDGAEQLNWLRWRQLLRRSNSWRGLIITTHTPGRLPILYQCEPNIRIVLTLVDQLTVSTPWLNLHPLATDLFNRYHGNCRQVLRRLYDYCSELPDDLGQTCLG